MFYGDRLTDRHDVIHCRFSKFCECARNNTLCDIRQYIMWYQTVRCVISDSTLCDIRQYIVWYQTVYCVISDSTLCDIRHPALRLRVFWIITSNITKGRKSLRVFGDGVLRTLWTYKWQVGSFVFWVLFYLLTRAWKKN